MDGMNGIRGVATPRAPGPRAGAPYSHAVVVGDLVFCAGQAAVEPETRREACGPVPPARSAVEARLLGARVEIEVVARL